MTTDRCPTCGGPRLYALTYRHVPNGCQLGAAQDATRAADHERLDGRAWTCPGTLPTAPARLAGLPRIVRPATEAERTLSAALTGTEPGPDAVAVVVRVAVGVPHVYVDGHDPDAAEEVPAP